MANLACQLQEMGHHVEIVTAQWHPAWPRQIVHQGVPVTRIPNPPIRAWGTLRYMMSLGRWLRQHQGRFDVVYVSMLKHSATVAVTRFKNSPLPVVLRAEGPGESGDCHWQTVANFGMRIRRVCQESTAVVATSREIEQELLDAQYDRDKVHFIANGVRVGAVATPESRLLARENLAAANPALALPESAPLVLFTGRLHPGKGLLKLVKTWPNVLARVPNARLYLVGEGPQEGELRGMISALGLQSRIILPGVFDNVEDLLHAANAFVLPSHFEGMSYSLMEAMSVGLPVIVSDIPGNR
ncbi:MAG: glycosyltransferase, partial [Pirellulaceae bacterium]